eukprot:gene27071-35542_t
MEDFSKKAPPDEMNSAGVLSCEKDAVVDQGVQITKDEDKRVSENSSFSFPITTLPQLTFVPTKLTTKDFKRVEYLVNGSNSSIFMAYHGNEKVAVKMIKENPTNLNIAEQELVFEAGILARLKHPNIISISGVGEKTRKFIVLEYLEGGTLAQLLKGQKPGYATAKTPAPILPVSSIISIAFSLASALKYLHVDVFPNATIIHRDLKPQNIGFTKDGQLKLFDFGLMACVKRRQSATEAYQMTGYTGTMTSGVAPYTGMYQEDFMNKIVRGGSRPKIREDLPPALFNLIERCWDCDPTARPSCAEIMDILATIKDVGVKREPSNINSFGTSLLKIFLGGSGGFKVADESSAMSIPNRK